MSEEELREQPEWLNEEFLNTALKEGLNEPDLTMTSCHFELVGVKGDNYSSIMFRIKVEYETPKTEEPQPLSMVCKIPPPGVVGEFTKRSQQFSKESLMFMTIIPEINALLEKHIENHTPLAARGIWSGTEPESCIIMEDLRVKNFEILDRFAGFDLKTCVYVLKHLARFHASSRVVFEENPQWKEEVAYSIWCDENPESSFASGVFEVSLKSLIIEAATWENFPQEWLDRLKALQESGPFSREVECFTLEEDSLNVLCHGDCWINNIMFRKGDNNKLEELRFVDLAMSSWNSWALDLNYFFALCPKKEIRVFKFRYLLKIYYEAFMETIQALGVSLPREYTLQDFEDEYNRRSFFGLFAFVSVFPLVIFDHKAHEVNPDDLAFNVDTKRLGFRDQRYQNMIHEVLPFYINAGAL